MSVKNMACPDNIATVCRKRRSAISPLTLVFIATTCDTEAQELVPCSGILVT